MLDFFRSRLVKLLGTRIKLEFKNEKVLPTAGLHPTTSCLLEWRSNQLRNAYMEPLWL